MPRRDEGDRKLQSAQMRKPPTFSQKGRTGFSGERALGRKPGPGRWPDLGHLPVRLAGAQLGISPWGWGLGMEDKAGQWEGP